MRKNSPSIAERLSPPAEGRQVSHPPRDSRRASWLALLIFAVAIVTMGRICAHDFSEWDDRYTIATNPRLNPPTWQSVRYYWSHGQYGLWIPGTYMAWAGLAKIARLSQPDERGVWLNPWVFHAASVLLHALAAVVLFELLRRILQARGRKIGTGAIFHPSPTLGESGGEGDNRPSSTARIDLAAALGALLFAVHPVQVEAIAWASGLKDVLCGLLGMVALWKYVSAAQAEGRHPFAHYLAATLAVAGAMLCKPTAIVVPAMALVLDLLILRRGALRAIVWTIPWWLMAVAIAIVAKLVQPGIGIASTVWYLKPLVAADALAFYLWKLAWPLGLAVDYGRTPAVALAHGWLYWTWLFPAALAAWLICKRNAWLAAAACLFVIGLAPVLGFTRFLFQYYSTVADHYLYLPMIGVAMAAAYVIWRFQTRLLVALAAAVVVLLAARSIVQAGIWSSDQSLFSHVLRVNPDSFLAYDHLSLQLRHEAGTGSPADRRQDFERAAALLRQGLKARLHVTGGIDDDPDLHRSLGDVYLDLNKPAAAMVEHARALELELKRPPEIQTYVFELTRGLGRDNFLLGNDNAALKYLNLAERMRPGDATIEQERSAVLSARGKK